MDEQFLRPVEVAKRYGVSKSKLAKWRLTGDGPPYCKLSRKLVVYDVVALDEWVKARERLSTSDDGGEG